MHSTISGTRRRLKVISLLNQNWHKEMTAGNDELTVIYGLQRLLSLSAGVGWDKWRIVSYIY